jgi:MFS transporter, ACS family, hexuronate transporter
LGATVTPLLVTPIAHEFGWRGAFWFTGLVGVLWLAWWFLLSRRLPTVETAPAAEENTKPPGWRDARLWAFMCAYGLGGLPLAFVLYQTSLYLSRVLGKSQVEIGSVLWVPPLGWELGYFFWGWLTDRVVRGSAQPLRQYGWLLALATAGSLPLAAIPIIASYALVLAALFFAMFVGAGFIILAMAYATTVFSLSRSGFIAGLGAGSWSAVVTLVMPLFGRLFDQHQYSQAFLLAALFPVAGCVLWWTLNARDLK